MPYCNGCDDRDGLERRCEELENKLKQLTAADYAGAIRILCGPDALWQVGMGMSQTVEVFVPGDRVTHSPGATVRVTLENALRVPAGFVPETVKGL